MLLYLVAVADGNVHVVQSILLKLTENEGMGFDTNTFTWIFRQQQQTQPNIPQPDTKPISGLGKYISYLICDYLNAEYFHIHIHPSWFSINNLVIWTC